MDCGIPFCHNGCPLGNLIPEWNDLVYRSDWAAAADRLHATNNFPEFTGRLCPAPCEAACVLGINADPVTIKQVEVEIIDRAWADGGVVPVLPDGADRVHGRRRRLRPGRAGRGAAADPRRARGHRLRARRRASAGCCATASPSSRWRSGTWTAGSRRWRPRAPGSCPASPASTSAAQLAGFSAVVLAGRRAGGARPAGARPRAGRHPPGDGVPAAGQPARGLASPITAAGKHVVIIGGGDTGADCLGTAHRQGAASVTQLEIMPRPPKHPGGEPAVADLPDDLPGLLRARGGRRARLRGLHRGVRRRRRRARCARCG